MSIAPVSAWAVISRGRILPRTVSDTRRAAIVNWLATEGGRFITMGHTDEKIMAMWNTERATSVIDVVEVEVRVLP